MAAAHARDRHGLERITIVDFDVHHGNGTQAIFERNPAVQYLSTHQSGLYPHSGSVYERGVGNIHNLLLPPGSDGCASAMSGKTRCCRWSMPSARSCS